MRPLVLVATSLLFLAGCGTIDETSTNDVTISWARAGAAGDAETVCRLVAEENPLFGKEPGACEARFERSKAGWSPDVIGHLATAQVAAIVLDEPREGYALAMLRSSDGTSYEQRLVNERGRWRVGRPIEYFDQHEARPVIMPVAPARFPPGGQG